MSCFSSSSLIALSLRVAEEAGMKVLVDKKCLTTHIEPEGSIQPYLYQPGAIFVVVRCCCLFFFFLLV
jgi:hypothetical protein